MTRSTSILAVLLVSGCGASAGSADGPLAVDGPPAIDGAVGSAADAASGSADGPAAAADARAPDVRAAAPDAPAAVPDAPLPDAAPSHLAAKVIGPAGGSLDVPGGLRIDFPAGALAVDTEITADPGPAVPGGVPGLSFDLGPTGTRFAVPVNLEYTYTSLPADLAPPGLRPMTREEGSDSWIGLPSRLDPSSTQASGKVLAESRHFSPIALGAFAGGGSVGLGQTPGTAAHPSVRYSAFAEFHSPALAADVVPMVGCTSPSSGGPGNLTAVSAGPVTISSPSKTVVLPVDPTYHVYSDLSLTDGVFFSPTDPSINFSWPGDTIGAFSFPVTPVPGDFTTSIPLDPSVPVTIDRSVDLVVPWTVIGSSAGWQIQVFLYDGPSRVITCVFDASAGSGTVPKASLQILSPGVSAQKRMTISSHHFAGAPTQSHFVVFDVQYSSRTGVFQVL